MEKDHIKIQDSTYLLHCLWGKYSGIWDSFRLFFMQTKKAALCIMLAVDLVYFFFGRLSSASATSQRSYVKVCRRGR